MVQDTYKKVVFDGNQIVQTIHHAGLTINNNMTFCWRGLVRGMNKEYMTLIDKLDVVPTGFLFTIAPNSRDTHTFIDSGVNLGTFINMIDFGVPVYIVFTVDSGTLRVKAYKNAMYVNEIAYVSLTANVSTMYLGGRGGGGGQYLVGDVYEYQVYDRALTEAEINYNYLHPNNPRRRGLRACYAQHQIDKPAAGSWNDTSPINGNDAPIFATTAQHPGIKARCNALFFPTAAGSDRVDCGNGASLALGTTISVEFWIKTDRNRPNPLILGSKWGANNGWEASYGSKLLAFYSDTGYSIQSVTIPDFNDGTWKHVVFTHTDGAATGEVYVNGVNKTNTRAAFALTNSATNLYIGNSSGFSSAPVGGFLAATRVYNRILSAAEVLYNMQHPAAPIRRGCVLNLSQESLYGTRWYDLSGNANHGTITGAVARRIGSISGR